MSLNLRAIANRATSAINPNISATILRANGTTQGPSYKRTPNYDEPIAAQIQLQPIEDRDIQKLTHINGLNIGDIEWCCYCNVQLIAVDRKAQKGGDLLRFADPDTGSVDTWLVSAIFEGWKASGWCRAALTKQIDQLTWAQIDEILAGS